MVFIHGFGMHVPARVVTNEKIAASMGKTPDWIEGATGIRERRWAETETSVADLAVLAAQDCLRSSQIVPGMIIVASGTAKPGFPGPAAEVAARLGYEGIPALDVPMASSGSLFGMALASKMVESYGDVLVIGAEKMSAAIQNLEDPNTAILFGDGAGAALISNRLGHWKILNSVLRSDGQFRDQLTYDGASKLHMNGLSVIMQASRKIPAAIQEALASANIAASDVTAFLMHQANQNLIVRVAKALGVPGEKFYSNIERYGNTSSASMLIAAAEWAANSPQDGPIVFAAFGAGYHWGALVAVSEK